MGNHDGFQDSCQSGSSGNGTPILELTLPWVPASKKNRHVIAYRGGRCPKCGRGKAFLLPNKKARKDEKTIHQLAAAHWAKDVLPANMEIFLHIRYIVARKAIGDRTEIRAYALGKDTRPKSRQSRGLGRDVQNIPECVCDALQGVLYVDDKRIKQLYVERVYE